MYDKWASYTDLPFELREQILVICTRGSLAALSATAKAVAHEAEVMLYETVSLHESRERELNACLRTLTGSRSSRKAQLVHTFAVTFIQGHNSKTRKKNRKDMKSLRGFIQLALRGMTGLTTLSVWAPEDVNTIGIEQVLRKQHFHLRRLYINNIKDFGRLLECQPSLEVVGLWFKLRYMSQLSEKGTQLKWKLSQRQLNSFAHSRSLGSRAGSSAPQAHPIIFNIHYAPHDSPLRCLTIYEYPLKGCQTALFLAKTPGEGSDVHSGPKLFDLSSKNTLLVRQVHEDMKLDFGEIDQNLCLVLPEISPAHLRWASKVFSQVAGLYPPDVRMPFVTLSVIDLPKPSIDMVSRFFLRQETEEIMQEKGALYEPFKQLIVTLVTGRVDDLEIRAHFEAWDSPRLGYCWAEEDSPAIIKKFGSIVREVVGEKLGREGSFWFQTDYDECCFPRDWHEFD